VVVGHYEKNVGPCFNILLLVVLTAFTHKKKRGQDQND